MLPDSSFTTWEIVCLLVDKGALSNVPVLFVVVAATDMIMSYSPKQKLVDSFAQVLLIIESSLELLAVASCDGMQFFTNLQEKWVAQSMSGAAKLYGSISSYDQRMSLISRHGA